MTFDQHLAHLLWMLEPPFTYHCWPQVKFRAKQLAAQRDDCAELPALVEAEYARIKAEKGTTES